MHILLFLEPSDKITTIEQIDSFISAEIPSQETAPRLNKLVQGYMMHGPCGENHKRCPCIIDKKCSKYYPRPFIDKTTLDNEGYPTYRRRDDGYTVEVSKTTLDNRNVVPYNLILL